LGSLELYGCPAAARRISIADEEVGHMLRTKPSLRENPSAVPSAKMLDAHIRMRLQIGVHRALVGRLFKYLLKAVHINASDLIPADEPVPQRVVLKDVFDARGRGSSAAHP
jgi:hypothetical protein